MNNPKLIGLLGGMSWPSTIQYYERLNKEANRVLGGSHSARIIIWSDDYEQIERLQLAGHWQEAGKLLGKAALNLENAGAEVLGIACNTMHKVVDDIRTATTLPLLDMIQLTVDKVAEQNASKVAVLGTNITMESGIYSERFASLGIATINLSNSDSENLYKLIYDKLCLGIIDEPASKQLQTIIANVADQGADVVVLACTELQLALSAIDQPVTIIDSAEVHIQALLEASLARKHAPSRNRDVTTLSF